MPAVPETVVSVRLFGDAVLRRRCREVDAGEDVTDLVETMLATMAAHDGVGLAAPQIGDPRRVIVAEDPKSGKPPVVLINPRIEESFGAPSSFEEGCLSFPNLYVHLTRPSGVEVSYRDLAGAERRLRDDGILARVVQHELDHLDGILYIDRLPRWRRWLLGLRLLQLRRRSAEVAA